MCANQCSHTVWAMIRANVHTFMINAGLYFSPISFDKYATSICGVHAAPVYSHTVCIPNLHDSLEFVRPADLAWCVVRR
jgi:hypothetical protein